MNVYDDECRRLEVEVESGSAPKKVPNSNAGTSRSLSFSPPHPCISQGCLQRSYFPLQLLLIARFYHIWTTLLVNVTADHLPDHARAPSEAPTSSRHPQQLSTTITLDGLYTRTHHTPWTQIPRNAVSWPHLASSSPFYPCTVLPAEPRAPSKASSS